MSKQTGGYLKELLLQLEKFDPEVYQNFLTEITLNQRVNHHAFEVSPEPLHCIYWARTLLGSQYWSRTSVEFERWRKENGYT